MKRILLLIPLFLLVSCASPILGDPLSPLDSTQMIIFYNGTVVTMEEDLVAEAIAIRGESIEAVGSSEDILQLEEDGAKLIDLQGLTLMPGFVDSHTHILNDHRSLGMSLDEAQFYALKNGITSLGTLYADESFLKEIQFFSEADFLRVRTSLYLVATDPCGNEFGSWWKKYPPTPFSGEMLEILGIKIITDGGTCGQPALSFEREPGEGKGDLWFSQEELNKLVSDVHVSGYQAAVHAIGDKAVTQALNAIEQALQGEPNDLRHRIEHVSVINPEDINRFGNLEIIPTINGQYPNCFPFGPPIPAEYNDMEWPWRNLRTENPSLAIAWQSDYPFLSVNPFVNLLGFVTRIDVQGRAICHPGEWLRDDTVSVEDALSIMTLQSAYAIFRDHEVGSLVQGKKADLIVLSANPLLVDPNLLYRNGVLLTMVGGRTEYCTSENNHLCPSYQNRIPVPLPDLRPPVSISWLGVFLILGSPFAAIYNRRFRLFVQRGGVFTSGVISGISWIIISPAPNIIDPSIFLLLITTPSILFSLAIARLNITLSDGKIGRFGKWLSLLGLIMFAEATIAVQWFLLDEAWLFMQVGILAHATGLSVIGIAKFRAGGFSFWGVSPFFLGLIGLLLSIGIANLFSGESDISGIVMFFFVGIGWLLIGKSILEKSM